MIATSIRSSHVLGAIAALVILAPQVLAQPTATVVSSENGALKIEFSGVTSEGLSGVISIEYNESIHEIDFEVTEDGTVTFEVDESILDSATAWDVIDSRLGSIGDGLF